MNADVKTTKCRFDLRIGYEWRIHRVTKKSQGYEALNIEVQYSKKRLGRASKINGSFYPLDFSFPPLSEIFKGQISPPGIHKGFLEKSRKIW